MRPNRKQLRRSITRANSGSAHLTRSLNDFLVTPLHRGETLRGAARMAAALRKRGLVPSRASSSQLRYIPLNYFRINSRSPGGQTEPSYYPHCYFPSVAPFFPFDEGYARLTALPSPSSPASVPFSSPEHGRCIAAVARRTAIPG